MKDDTILIIIYKSLINVRFSCTSNNFINMPLIWRRTYNTLFVLFYISETNSGLFTLYYYMYMGKGTQLYIILFKPALLLQCAKITLMQSFYLQYFSSQICKCFFYHCLFPLPLFDPEAENDPSQLDPIHFHFILTRPHNSACVCNSVFLHSQSPPVRPLRRMRPEATQV